MPTTDDPDPALVVAAAPPDVAAAIIDRSLRTWPDALVTDVSSVKETVLEGVRVLARPEDLPRYIGSHPMAGREISGVIAARGDLFMGRPLVVGRHPPTAAGGAWHLTGRGTRHAAVP